MMGLFMALYMNISVEMTEVTYKTGDVTQITTEDGHDFILYYRDDLEIGDKVVVAFDTRGTEERIDDEIITLKEVEE